MHHFAPKLFPSSRSFEAGCIIRNRSHCSCHEFLSDSHWFFYLEFFNIWPVCHYNSQVGIYHSYFRHHRFQTVQNCHNIFNIYKCLWAPSSIHDTNWPLIHCNLCILGAVPELESRFQYQGYLNWTYYNEYLGFIPEFDPVLPPGSEVTEEDIQAVCGDLSVCRYDYISTLNGNVAAQSAATHTWAHQMASMSQPGKTSFHKHCMFATCTFTFHNFCNIFQNIWSIH